MFRPLVIALAVCAASSARAEESLAFEGRLSLAPGWDTNVGRQSAGPGVVADAALSALAALDLRWQPADGHLTSASWHGGTRVFADHGAEDQVAHVLTAGHALRFADAWVGAVRVRRRDQRLRSGARDASDTAGQLSLRWEVARRFAPELRLGWRRFDWWPDERWSGAGPTAGLGIEVRPFARHRAEAGWEAQVRTHPERREISQHGHLAWSWRGPVLLSGGYLLGFAESDVAGFAHVRHRLHLLLGAHLPLELMLGAQAVLQLVRFPEGFRLDQFAVADDEETLSSLSLKLARPIGAGLSLEARYQLHLATFVKADLAYERHLLGTAVTWRF